MSILKFKQFESNSNNDTFPSLQDIEEYFQDFTDEIDSKLCGYQSGYKFFEHGPNTFIDILNTNISNKILKFSSNYCYIYNFNLPEHSYNDTILNSIRSGTKAYKHLMVSFNEALLTGANPGFRQPDIGFPRSKLDLLIECLKRLYLSEGFRPYGILFENRVNLVGRLGFQGMLVNCSDEEYIKMCQIMDETGEDNTYNKYLTSHFL